MAISAGNVHTCGITADSEAACWGDNSSGQRDNVPAGEKFIALSAGNAHTCGITADNEAVCWGSDANNRSSPPSGRKFIAISAGNTHSCAITLDNKVVCWGSNANNRSSPPSGRKFIALSAGNAHSCGITADNEAVCWGSNANNRSSPPSGRKFIALSAGNAHSCGITADNEAVCWGNSRNGRTAPPQIAPISADSITITLAVSEADKLQINISAQAVIPAGSTQAVLTVTVRDDDVIEPETDYTINLSATGHTDLETDAIIVTVPVDSGDTEFVGDIDQRRNEVAENSPAGAEVGITMQAPEVTAYTLTDNAAGRFAIDGDSGLVTVAAAAELNFEDATTHSITAQASSTNNLYIRRFTVQISNVNELVLSDEDGRSEVASTKVGAVVSGLDLRANHPDDAPIIGWQLDEAGDSLFELTRPQTGGAQSLAVRVDNAEPQDKEVTVSGPH